MYLRVLLRRSARALRSYSWLSTNPEGPQISASYKGRARGDAQGGAPEATRNRRHDCIKLSNTFSEASGIVLHAHEEKLQAR